MKIVYRKRFMKQYRKLQKRQQHSVADVVDLFRQDPKNKKLCNHALKGDMQGMRSISAGFDLRIIFMVYGDYITVIMLSVGTHEEVY